MFHIGTFVNELETHECSYMYDMMIVREGYNMPVMTI